MQISHSHRFVFVHIFKTAGTSMRAVLEPYAAPPGKQLWHRFKSRFGYRPATSYPELSAHARALEIRKALPDLFGAYFKFAFVRNPWDWQVSWYHYILQNHDHHEHAIVARLAGFEDFLRWRIDHPVPSQKDFVTDEQGNEIVDFVGRFEAIKTDFAKVCAATGIRVHLPHLNRSQHAHYSTYYNERTRALVECYSKQDIEYFAYRFEAAETTVLAPWTGTAKALGDLRAA
jgi:hypothetical protein